ncbi:MAG TPA: flavodoxin family protein [Methanoculleus sp.]|nr:flavodoxin family protein [Methanoculleus sp.]
MTEAQVLRRTDIEGGYLLTLEREDLSRIYPGMVRYTVRVRFDGKTRAAFRTNTYEYTPGMPLDAGESARETFEEWARELAADPGVFIGARQPVPRVGSAIPVTDVLVIQGSPRAGGNCSIMADLAASAAREAGRTAQVIFPDDLYLRPCIGCYWCYNFAQCTFDDDMEGVIAAIRGARLIVVCTPVYTDTVPAALKMVIDRCQAYHAERALFGGPEGQTGLLLAVAGRTGEENFGCVRTVMRDFFRNLGIGPCGEVLAGGMDRARDVRTVPGIENRVRAAVTACLKSDAGETAIATSSGLPPGE